jgi:hypothetical protein
MATPAFYRPEDYGTPGANPDDSPLIQQAIDAAGQDGGGTVLLAARQYVLRSTLQISSGGVILSGCGWGAGDPFPGSWLHVRNAGIGAIRIAGGLRRSAILRDFAVRYDQPSIAPDWKPLDAPFAVDVDGVDDVLIQNLLLFNVSRGVRGFGSGRLHIEKLFGQPLITGIELDRIFDVPRINNVHFWPFWSGDEVVDRYTKLNATGIVSRRCDNPHFSNLFFLPYFRGLHFTAGGDGVTSKFRISQVDCDFCRDGIYIDGPNTTGQITNFTAQGTGLGGSTGLFVNANGVKVQIGNLRVTDVQTNAVRVQGNTDTMIAIENTWVDGWDRSNQGFPAIEAVNPGTKVTLGKSRWFFGGGAGPQAGGQGQVLQD